MATSTVQLVNSQGSCSLGNTATSTRSSTAKPAAFEAVERKPATGVGAPSYTSGAQKWNGTAETLKPKPTSTSITASTRTASGISLNIGAIAYRLVVPEKPNSRLKP